MERIILGKTGLKINRFGFGGIPIQTVDEATAVDTVRHAVSMGVDFIDTSRAYTTSEKRIGLALKQAGKRVVLASKSPCRNGAELRSDLEKSLEALDVPHIDLYQCHFVRNSEDYRLVVQKDGALDTLNRAKEEGLIGHIGITSHSLDILECALSDNLFETIMVCFSFLEPKAKERIIPMAQEKNVGVIAMKSFSGGVIDRPDLALKYALSQPGVAIIPGVESKSLFDENWAIYRKGDYSLNEAEQRAVRNLQEKYDKLFCRRCDYCQPCSEDIPISVVLHLRSILNRMGEKALKQPWFAYAVKAARKCSECGDCRTRCPYELPIPELIRDNIEGIDRQIV